MVDTNHIVIIGNGISGVTTARHIRKRSKAKITIISGETKYFYSRTALMYVFMGHMQFEHTQPYENNFWPKNNIDQPILSLLLKLNNKFFFVPVVTFLIPQLPDGLLKIISDYAYALDILDQYDYQSLQIHSTSGKETYQLTYSEAIKQIKLAKKFYGNRTT